MESAHKIGGTYLDTSFNQSQVRFKLVKNSEITKSLEFKFD